MMFIPLKKQTYGSTLPFTEVALLYVHVVRTSQETLVALHGLLQGYIYFLYVDDVRTSQEIHLCVSTTCYSDGFTFYA
jgi:hypothetical protein